MSISQSNTNKDIITTTVIILQTEKKQQTTPTETIPTTNIKMGELRQKEIKMRKWEDLKVREESLLDSNERYIRLETYIKRLESEKEEYENTIRTLKRKILYMENTHSYPISNNNVQDQGRSTNVPENTELLENIHKKVTNYILRQVDIQFQKIKHVHLEPNDSKNRINQHEQPNQINPMTTSSCAMEDNNTVT
ncbi:Hypothetical predicted protein [Mytilus galloprovincialis]|uniref:Uncharacterized protein n=1 Tax=Mytilus galloprovincialis TaxID=29158 RepID=A0A8B6GYX6_MYTGA|nr:Hypothetical predicted protein [Mytilus galloprovincialis]